MPSTFTVHEVAGGVWAAIAPGTAGPAVSNAAIIDLGDKTVVVDTFMTVQAAEELHEEVERLTGRAPFLVVNSHWHSDHVGGNQVFANSPIVGTRRMVELIIEDAPKDLAEFEERITSLRSVAERLAAGAETPEDRQQAQGTMALVDALAANADSLHLVLPDLLMGDGLDIEGERSVSIINAGRGHTESDLFVVADDIVVAGDLVWTAMHPKADDGFPAEWATAVDRLAALAPSAIVAGHGELGTLGDLTAMTNYMRDLNTMIVAVRSGDLDPSTADPPAGSEDWQGLSRFRKGLASLASRESHEP